MDFTAQSPDLNPLENIWKELDRRLRLTEIHNKGDLVRNLKTTWQTIEGGTIIKFLKSIPRPYIEMIKMIGMLPVISK